MRTVPPASFDEGDVATASRRITARRRVTATVGGTAVAAAVLVGGIGVGSGWFTSSTDTAASPPTAAPLTAAPGPQIESTGITPRSGGCKPDPGLVEAVEVTLPEAGGTTPTSVLSCPTGAKAAAFALRDGSAAGRVTVLVSPAGTAQAGQSAPGDVQRSDGAQQSVRKARSGKLVVVVSEPEAGSPAAPFGTRLAHVAGDLAARF
ncbi:hypothetical protein QFW96_27315 [Saccharopolyspora sp. TS4A08]|uniref:DUF5642 domain-containing protein n=1 Tax=Saccharopolyspora ipomoeae TaxID=3042027 RepID=A0ABT6PWG8_9PSEU|nr:hypothetical protein [Saccharopolyspora sp. TS4A08]MDI2032359.1 hypothetical protein [Saccharopolyspora sp. TS4A08]